MLSLLIPTYNYNVFPLVSELHQQCEESGIEYEIIAIEDNPEHKFKENEQINTLSNCRFFVNQINLGRASNLNKLVDKSEFDSLLILEADAFPKNKNYISLYIEAIKKQPKAVFGGVIYADEKPHDKAILRWHYGHARESKNLEYLLKNPLDIVFSWNLLIKKSAFTLPLFDASIVNYGFEDLVFLKSLKKQNIQILQIDNPLIHQNEEDSAVFLDKSKTALLTLKSLYHQKNLNAEDSRLLSAFELVKKLQLVSTVANFFLHFENKMKKKLLSKKPSLFIFDLYRLGYYCLLNKKRDV